MSIEIASIGGRKVIRVVVAYGLCFADLTVVHNVMSERFCMDWITYGLDNVWKMNMPMLPPRKTWPYLHRNMQWIWYKLTIVKLFNNYIFHLYLDCIFGLCKISMTINASIGSNISLYYSMAVWFIVVLLNIDIRFPDVLTWREVTVCMQPNPRSPCLNW